MIYKSLAFTINTGCNVNCPYCIVREDAHKGMIESSLWPQVNLLEKVVRKIDKPDSITWVGGEPGLWSYQLVGKLLEIIDNTYGKDIPVSVCTNGLFMKKFPFLLNDKRFYYNYHIVNPENYDLYKDPYIKLPNVNTCIVVTKEIQNNYELLKMYDNECQGVIWQLCDFPMRESTEYYKKYAFDKTLPTVLNSQISPMKVGENTACYNIALTLTSKNIEIYNCCSFVQSSKQIITYENYDSFNYDRINLHLIPMRQITENCKNCQRFVNTLSIK